MHIKINNFSWEISSQKLINFYKNIYDLTLKNNNQKQLQQAQYICKELSLKIEHYKTKNKELENYVNNLKNKNEQLEDNLSKSHKIIKKLESDLNNIIEEIMVMKSSKFWKIRHKWLKLKQILGINKIN